MPVTLDQVKEKVARIRERMLADHRSGGHAFAVVGRATDAMDRLLEEIFTETAGVAAPVCLVAVGGYGRGELCPHSDVDLMFLRESHEVDERIEGMIRLLWDSGLELGHAVRTPDACFNAMRDDITTAATLLESRYITGRKDLFDRYTERSVDRFVGRHGADFTRRQRELLARSLGDYDRSVFVVEPHMKESAGGLRDIQRMLWIERVRRGVRSLDEIAVRGAFTKREIQPIKEAYGFYLKVRCELHFRSGIRQDTLETESQAEVAEALGYADDPGGRAVEKLMADYYRHARSVYQFIRHYLETRSEGAGFLQRMRDRLFARRITNSLSLLDGVLYLTGDPRSRGKAERLPETILRIFWHAHRCDATLSQRLCEWIRKASEPPELDFIHSPEVSRLFHRILGANRNIGRVLTAMEETGVLGRILPEFGRLGGLVAYDGHHQLTVDAHSLFALRELDRMETDEAYPEQGFAGIYSGLESRVPLRLALLLHDIGKSVPGHHSESGTSIARVVCERLGVDEASTRLVEFLIYHHLAMLRLSEHDLAEAGGTASFARIVGTLERLEMLYLLTYLDIRSVRPGAWTGWRGTQLAEVYRRTAVHFGAGGELREGEIPEATHLRERLVDAGIDEGMRARIIDHCQRMNNPAYARETVPERMARHVEMATELATELFVTSHEDYIGYSEVTIACRDRPFLFADIVGVLLSEGLNILGARVNTRDDGIAVDLFDVEIGDKVRVDMAGRMANLRRKFADVEAGRAKVTDIIEDRKRRYRTRRPRPALYPPRVHIDNDISENFTVIEIDAGDRMGLLFDLAGTMSTLGLDIRSAKLLTLVDRAHDVFYVLEQSGGKVLDQVRQSEIEEALISSAEG